MRIQIIIATAVCCTIGSAVFAQDSLRPVQARGKMQAPSKKLQRVGEPVKEAKEATARKTSKKSMSIRDLLGIKLTGKHLGHKNKKNGSRTHDRGGRKQKAPSSRLPLVTTVTDDPFSGMVETGAPNKLDERGVGIGKEESVPYGSIPLIRSDESSVEFLTERLIYAAQSEAIAQGKTPNAVAALRTTYRDYATELAKTLSLLSQEQQDYIFYGPR